MKQNYAKSYQRVQAISASKIGQVALLLDHCVRLLDRAVAAIHENKIEERYLNLDQAIVILCTIDNNIDAEASEHAKRLKSFFQRMVTGLREVNYQNNPDLCTKLQTCILGMANIWHNADKAPGETSISTESMITAASLYQKSSEAVQITI